MEQEFFAKVKEFVKGSFLKYGRFDAACFMMVDEDAPIPPFMISSGNLVFLPMPIGNNVSKDEAAMIIRLTAEKLGATALTFVTEAWMVSSTKEDYAEVVRTTPSKHAKRQECLMITDETKTAIKATVIPIIRMENGTPILGEADQTIPDEISGRFANFLYGH